MIPTALSSSHTRPAARRKRRPRGQRRRPARPHTVPRRSGAQRLAHGGVAARRYGTSPACCRRQRGISYSYEAVARVSYCLNHGATCRSISAGRVSSHCARSSAEQRARTAPLPSVASATSPLARHQAGAAIQPPLGPDLGRHVDGPFAFAWHRHIEPQRHQLAILERLAITQQFHTLLDIAQCPPQAALAPLPPARERGLRAQRLHESQLDRVERYRHGRLPVSVPRQIQHRYARGRAAIHDNCNKIPPGPGRTAMPSPPPDIAVARLWQLHPQDR